MRRFVLVLALIVGALSTPIASVAISGTHVQLARRPVDTGSLQLFATEAAAQAHCPNDAVVWLNTNTGIYHEKGMRWYGNTKHGAFVCRKEADAAGDRDTRNGQ